MRGTLRRVSPHLGIGAPTHGLDTDDLCFARATDLAADLAAGRLSARELLEACLARIARLDPQVNAICTLAADQARAAALRLDEAFARGGPVGPLHGLPVGIKDLVPTAGIRTTFGSPIYRDYVPRVDALVVERMRAAGAIVVGKTNTPEFGAGSQTFNAVFGATRNPYDPTKTCGGSSGGSAVALACGMLPLADGTDLGGSLRNPASFNNVVGIRPSIGRVPEWPARSAWQVLNVHGPMGRTAADVALALSVMSGPDARAPLSNGVAGESLRGPLERSWQGARIAWTPDLGRYPVDRGVVTVCESAVTTLEGLGCRIDLASPDFDGADETFQVLRAAYFAAEHAHHLAAHRDLLKDTVVWNIEQGQALTAAQVASAEARRTAIYHNVRAFMEHYDFLVLPVAQVPPFPLDEPWVSSINDVPMLTYIDWMASCYAITLTGLPAASVPAGFTDAGLPVGLQIVGRHHRDIDVLQLAHALEGATGHWRRHPSSATARPT